MSKALDKAADHRKVAAEAGVRPRLLRLAFKITRSLLIAYLLIVLLMTFLENRLVYPIPPASEGDWSPTGVDYEDVGIESAGGVTLHGWFFPREGASRAILYLHGNSELVADKPLLMKFLGNQFDAAVLKIDYRGYGKSGGRPHEAGLIADGVAAQKWLAEKTDREPGEVLLIGRSLGGGVAVACAAELGAEALVLQSTFSRMTDAAAHHMPWLPVRLVMRNRYDSIARLQQYEGPLFVSHGTVDKIVPFELGRRLFDASPSKPKEFFTMPGQGHNQPMPRQYYDALGAFLEKAGQ
ncbi:MAG: alpha/beta hydrolase [Planctomycetota bacterium]